MDLIRILEGPMNNFLCSGRHQCLFPFQYAILWYCWWGNRRASALYKVMFILSS